MTATELPDGALPSPGAERQLHRRPDARAGAGDDRARRRAARHGAPVHDELHRQQALSGHRARLGDVRHAGSERSGEAGRDDEPSTPLHAPRRRVRAAAVRRRHRRAVHRRRRRTGSAAVRRARQPHRAEARAADDRDLDRQRQRRRAGQPARARVRHDDRTLRRVRRDGGAAAGGEAVRRAAHARSRRAGDDGVQLGRVGGAEHGVVSPRVVPPRAVVLGNVRESAVATERGDAARRVGVPRAADPEQPGQAAADLDARRRPRPVQPERDARRDARLGRGERAHGARARGEGVSVPVPFHGTRGTAIAR